MTTNDKGFTLIEVLITLSMLGIISLISISVPNEIHDKFLLKSTAAEIKSALELSQQLSLDESREYAVELLNDEYRVREFRVGGKIVLFKKLDINISVYKGSQNRIYYTRDGTTNYGKFILINDKDQKITIDTLIGTGKVRISNIY